MAFSRASLLRSCFRAARPTVARPQLFRQIARRGYASGGHGSAAQAGGDAAWAAGAAAVTVPTIWYLLSGSNDGHGHDDHGDAHGKSHDKEAEEESKDEAEPKGDEESKDDEKPKQGEKSESEEKKGGEDEEKSEDSDSDDESKGTDTPATSDDGNVHKSIPDAKSPGGSKKRVESTNAIKQGEETEDNKGQPSASKTPGNRNTQSGKQEGLSNTDTKHSTDITRSSEKSTKPGGSPETSKAKGTVDSSKTIV